MPKMRVWWLHETEENSATFYVPVESPEEAVNVINILAAYDSFLSRNNLIPSYYCNAGGLEVWDDDAREWNDWHYEDDNASFDSIDDYCEAMSDKYDELEKFRETIFGSLNFENND